MVIPWVWFWALFLSVLLHLIVLNGLQFSWPAFDFDAHVIETELVSTAKVPKPLASKKKKH